MAHYSPQSSFFLILELLTTKKASCSIVKNEATNQELSPLKSALCQGDPKLNRQRKVRLSNDIQTIEISQQLEHAACFTGHTEKIQGSTPHLPQNRASTSPLKSILRPLFKKYMGDDTKVFMKKGKYKFRSTPGERRKRDLKTTSIEGLECLLHEIFPNNWSIHRKKEMVKPYIVEYLTRDESSGKR